MARQRLTREMKCSIVVHLAMFMTPSKVRDLIEAEYGVVLKLNTIVYYDPTTTAADRLSQKYRDLFDKTRERYLADCARVPIMHKAYRARMLQEILEDELEQKNTIAAKITLEQAAKEEGGAFTNKREHTGAGGAPIAHSLAVHFVAPTPTDPTGDHGRGSG